MVMVKSGRGVGKVSGPRMPYPTPTGARVGSQKSPVREELDGYTAAGVKAFRDE